MKNEQLSSEDSMTFTKIQIYLILGCIVAIAVLSFSLGHLVSRKSSTGEPVAEKVYGSDQVAEEAMEELSRLEERLNAVKSYSGDDAVSAGDSESPMSQPGEGVSVVKIEPVVESPAVRPTQQSGQRPEPAPATPLIEKAKLKPVRVKSIRDVAKAGGAPRGKSLNVKKKIIAKKSARKPAKKSVTTKRKGSVPIVGLSNASVVKPKLPPMPPQPEFKTGSKTKSKSSGVAPKTKKPKKEYVPSNSRYTIQVATFPSREKAEGVKKDLRSKGYKAYIHTLNRTRSVWYRVRVGGYQSKDDAVDTILDLREKEGFQAVIDRYQKPSK